MAGWTGVGKDKIRWDGTICAKNLCGDGSLITGLAVGGDVTASVALTDGTIIQGDGGAKGVKTSTETIAHITTAYNHSQDNTQAHSDYLKNNGDTGTGDYTFDMTDNTADIFSIVQGANHYMCCNTNNGSESVVFGCGAVPTIMTIEPTLVSTEVNLDVDGDIVVSGSVDGQDIAGMAGFVTSNSAHRGDATGADHSTLVSSCAINTTKVSYTDAALMTANVASTAINTAKVSYTDAALVAANVASTAINTAKVTYDDATVVAANTASCVVINTNTVAIAKNTASCVVIDPHIADTTDPHGALLTQTNITSSGTSSCAQLNITADNTTASVAMVRNVVIGVDATPPTASSFTRGTVYVQYTA